FDPNQINLGKKIFFDNLENQGMNWSFTSSAGLTNEFYYSPYTSMGFAKQGNYFDNSIIDIFSREISLSGYVSGKNKLVFMFYLYPVINDSEDIFYINYKNNNN
ncbi:MAG: hypothetical protein N3A56_06020, partial [Thermodesulfobacteriaceae bacterium]|nr:hypothetical protein [Thermodesulfobacteriaceae bacterium]